MRTLNENERLRLFRGGGVIVVRYVEAWSDQSIWHRQQAVLRLLGRPNFRDHLTCRCPKTTASDLLARRKRKDMAQALTALEKVGNKNRRSSTATGIRLIGTDLLEALMDETSELFTVARSNGVRIAEGEDYELVKDGNIVSPKSGHTVMSRWLRHFIAVELGFESVIQVPITPEHGWCAFLIQVNAPLDSDSKRDAYLKPKGSRPPTIEATASDDDESTVTAELVEA